MELLPLTGVVAAKMVIIPDPALVAVQIVPFLVTLAALYFIIFKPMLGYLEQREQVIEEGRAEAAQLEARIDERMADYEQRLAKARAQVTELRRKLRSEAQGEYDEIVAQAQKEADQQVAEAVKRIEAETEAARVGLEETARALAGDISSRVLSPVTAVS